MPREPKISLCVPVYNAEKYLANFLDSVLQQSFEDVEIVLTDNQSTDRTMEILRAYERQYPEKIIVCQNEVHSEGPGRGRNTAYRKSRGEYILWCDADDYLNPNALKFLYEEAVKYDADIVCGNAVIVKQDGDEIISVSPYSRNKTMAVSNETAIFVNGTEFWMRIIRRGLIEQVAKKIGLMMDDSAFDDVGYLPILSSYAKTIRTLNYPVYYWRRHVNSGSSMLSKKLCLDSVEAVKYFLENGNQKYLEALQLHAAARNRFNLNTRWPFFDVFVNEARSFSPWLYSNQAIKNNKLIYNKVRWADELADITFSQFVYVDGFSSVPLEARLQELQERVFHDGCTVVILNEENCDIEENPYIKRAYERGDLYFVACYFALKRIYEQGGVFLHDSIRILEYFSFLKYQNSFFALIDNTTYSDRIFGGSAGNEAIGSILGTYSDEWDKKGEYMPLPERISIILTAKYGIPLDGKERLFGKVVSVLSPALSVVDTRFGDTRIMCAFEHDFSTYAGEPEYITLPRATLRVLMTSSAGSSAGNSAREKELERELEEMKQSNTYKLMMKIRAIGDGPHGPFLKKIFHGMLRVRKKLLRK